MEKKHLSPRKNDRLVCMCCGSCNTEVVGYPGEKMDESVE